MSKVETIIVHGGEKPDPITGAVAPPLIRTKTFKQPEFGKKAEWEYGRAQNPTRHILEEKLAAIEGGGKAVAFSSGLAAETMLFLTLEAGDHLILPKEVYGGTIRLLNNVFSKYGITYTQVDFSSKQEIRKAITPRTKYFFIEALTNPSLTPIDLKSLQDLSKETGIPVAADMTFCPPCCTRAFDYNADIIIQSISKYLSGHNDVLGGALITKDLALYERLKLLQKAVGAVLSPDECYRAIQGIKTLSIRWQRMSESALKIAQFLESHSKIKKVLYPGLENHKGHEIAKNQMRNGFGGVVSFELISSTHEKLKQFVDKIQENGIIIYGESLASPETLLAYPYTMSHGALPAEVKEKLGITRSFFRLSIGLENADDLIKELEAGLEIYS
ncbi:MAG: PLP-dependent transferase [Nanoarchaeota archaeon]|nr:PLP-dependent transferase [Nanoarchaeota archaeon]